MKRWPPHPSGLPADPRPALHRWASGVFGVAAAGAMSLAGCGHGDGAGVSHDAGAPTLEAASRCRHVEAGTPGFEGGGPPSCAEAGAGRTTCGSCESCCVSPHVPGGSFNRSYSTPYCGDGSEAGSPATVTSYRLDKYDVTVGRFRAFVAVWKAGWAPAEGDGKHAYLNGGKGLVNNNDAGGYEPGWSPSADGKYLAPTDAHLGSCEVPTWTAAPGPHEDLPMNCVTSAEAFAFCIWDGGFLPSEAEWQYAAAGGSEQRQYPWGFTDPGSTNEYAIYGNGYGTDFYPADGGCPGYSDPCNIAPVGSARQGAGRWGQLDLVGEVYQFVADRANDDFVEPCHDCVWLDPRLDRQAMGGCFTDSISYLCSGSAGTTGASGGSALGSRGHISGFRCGRAP